MLPLAYAAGDTNMIHWAVPHLLSTNPHLYSLFSFPTYIMYKYIMSDVFVFKIVFSTTVPPCEPGPTQDFLLLKVGVLSCHCAALGVQFLGF